MQVLSIRAQEGHQGVVKPKFGNRILAHVLVKFDTEQVKLCSAHILTSSTNFRQSLEMYNDRGVAVHKPASNDQGTFYDEKEKQWRRPAARRRVTEYLVLEKRMWIDGPWQFKQQIWPTWNLPTQKT